MWVNNLKENEIFVFGSNYAGRHGKGAALTAFKKFGAKLGQGIGLMGNSYGIATKDSNLRVLSLDKIESQILKFLDFAKSRPDLTFIVTPIGCGLAGYKPKDIAPMFHREILSNVVLPPEFQWIPN